MESTLPVIKCEVTFLTEQEGGRKNPFGKGALSGNQYRPHVVVGDKDQRQVIVGDKNQILEEYLGVAFATAPDFIELGNPVEVSLTLMYYPNAMYDKLTPGTTFTIREGGQIVGYGKVMKPSNQ